MSTIRGEHATPGATVTATNTNTGERSTAVVQPDGTFVMVGIRPGTYSLQGAGEANSVEVPVGQTVTVDAAPAAAPATTEGGAIVVTGRRDRREVRTATVSTNVTPQQIENLPQNDRNFLNFAQLAPGVQVSPSGGDKRVQAGALASDQTNVFIDGLSLKNPVNHGGIAGQNFSQGNPFPQLAVQEFKVDTQNFKAEYDQAGSAIITAVTKTGGTDFHGDAFIQYQPKSWVKRKFFDREGEANNMFPDQPCPDDPTDRSCFKPKGDYKRLQYGADIGGPILPGKLHFFGAFEGTSTDLPSKAITLNANGQNNVPPELANELNGSVSQSFDQQLYFGKLTAFVTDDDTVDGSVFVRKEANLRDFGDTAAPSHGHDINSDGRLYQLEWKHRATNWLNEFTLAYNTFTNGTPRVSEGPEIILSPRINQPDPANPANSPSIGSRSAELGAHGFAQDDSQKTWTIKDNLTWEQGDHIIKGGVKIARTKMSRLEDNLSNGNYWFYGPTYDGFNSTVPWAAQISTVPVAAAMAKNTQFGIFIQDDWTPNEHWTVNAGIRWDYESDAKNEDFVTPAKVANALRNYEGWQAAGIDAEDYISDGSNRHPYKWAIAPRLGVSYDVRGDRDLVFFAGAGRYYDRPLFIVSGIETIKNYYQSVSTITFCGGTGVEVDPAGCIPWSDSYRDTETLRGVAIAQGLGGDVWVLNNKTKLPYSDQLNLGVRKRFGDWNTAVTLSHIRSKNLFRYVRGNRFSNGWYTRRLIRNDAGEVIGCTDGGTNWVVDDFPNTDYPACPATHGDLTGFNGKLNIGSNNGQARYSAIYFQADKPYTKASGWGVSGTLTLQRARSNVASELSSDEFFSGPDERQYGWQHVQGVPKWQFVGTGMVGLPWDFLLSATVVMNSGPAFGYVHAPWNSSVSPPDNACCDVNLGGVYFPPKDFAYKTVDMRIAKTFRTPWGHELEADFQVYNLFDWVNRTYTAWGAGAGDHPTFEENDTVGTARAFQAGLKYSF